MNSVDYTVRVIDVEIGEQDESPSNSTERFPVAMGGNRFIV